VRLYLGAAALVAVVLGGAWLLLAFTFGRSHSPGDAFTESAACVRRDRALTSDSTAAAPYRVAGLKPLGIRWKQVRAVALFDDALNAQSVTKEEKLISSRLQRQGDSPTQISSRLQSQDNVALFYLAGSPSAAAEAAIGRCVYLVHFNRVASVFGLYISPHSERPFRPGARRED